MGPTIVYPMNDPKAYRVLTDEYERRSIVLVQARLRLQRTDPLDTETLQRAATDAALAEASVVEAKLAMEGHLDRPAA